MVKITLGNFEGFNFPMSYKGSLTEMNGTYEVLNDSNYAIFSYNNQNYLFLKDRLLVINPNTKIEYYFGHSKAEESYFIIYEGNTPLHEVHYINPHPPISIDSDMGYEDWEESNFAYLIAQYIEKVHQNPNIILFPNKENN